MASEQGDRLADQSGLFYVLELTQEIGVECIPSGEGCRQLLFDARAQLIDEYLTDFWLSYGRLCHVLQSDPRDPLIQVPWACEQPSLLWVDADEDVSQWGIGS